MNRYVALFVVSLLVVSTAAAAQTDSNQGGPHGGTSAASVPLTDGEVRKIDKSAGKVTIKHGAITNLDMPAMTMVFRVKDPAILDQLKEGEKVKFAADKIDGALTVTQVQSTR